MELQLGKQEHRMYTRVFDRTEEETCSVDAVVPDALGDLSALVVTEGTFCLWNLAFSDKSAQIEGCIAADVVYAEESGALRSFPVELPVKVHMSGETLAEDVRPWLRCTLAALDARAVNSRKVRVTARLSLCLRAYRETELALTERIESDSGAVFTHSEPLCVHVPVAVEEQTFTATQMHRFSDGQPETDRLLCHAEAVLLDEVHIADGRAVVQGRVCTSVSYLQQGQSCPVAETFETPFSQLLDCPADTEPCLVQASVSLTAAYLNVSTAADGATLEAEYHLVAQAVCFGEVAAECVTDAYCNTAQLQLEWETIPAGTVQQAEPLHLAVEGVIACDAAALTVRAQRAELCGAASDGCDVLVRLLVTDAMYDKRDCATPPPLRIISAEAMKGELSRLQRRARCIVAHSDRLQGDGAAGQDQRRVPRAGRVRAEVYAGRAGQQRRHVHRRRWCADDHGVQPDNSRAAALYLRA